MVILSDPLPAFKCHLKTRDAPIIGR